MECKKVSVSVFVCLYYKICRDSFIVCACVCACACVCGRQRSGGGGWGGGGDGDILLCYVFRE